MGVVGPENAGVVTHGLSRNYSKISLSSVSTISHEQFSYDKHAQKCLKSIQDFRENHLLCDVTLISLNKHINAHRIVLAAASEYFSAMFTGALRESKDRDVLIDCVDSDILESIVNYCYTGMVEIREDNVQALLSTASLMQFHNIVLACSKFLINQLHPSNCLGIAAFAEHESCSYLQKEAENYMYSNIMQVVKNQEFVQMSADQLAKLLINDDLNVNSEEDTFNALVHWTQYDITNRKKFIGKLLNCIRLPLLTPAFLVDTVEPFLQIVHSNKSDEDENAGNHDNNVECQKLMMEAFKWHLLPERQLQLSTVRMSPRKSTLGKILVVGGMDKNKGSTSIEIYDPRLNKWSFTYQLDTKRLQFGIALLGNKLLVIGGRDGLKTLNTMEALYLDSGNWVQLAPMNTHRHGLGVAVLCGSLYAIGGHDGWSFLNNVERWDTVTRSWSYVAPMQIQRTSPGVAVLNNKLYAVGGRDGASCIRTVECYDPFMNKWTMCAPLSRRRGGVGVAVSNGYIYAIGGQDAPANNPCASRCDCVERYDPSNDTWTTIAPLSSKRDSVAACVFANDQIISIGGFDGHNYLTNVEQYDPHTDTWSHLAPLNIGRAGACAISITNDVCIGTNNKQDQSDE